MRGEQNETRRPSIRRAALWAVALVWVILLPGFAQPQQAPPAVDTPQALPGSSQPSLPGAAPAYRQANTVAVLRVEGVIDFVTLASLERRIEQAMRDGADAIVLDISTPGGRLDATLDICHLLKTDAPANTVAWINPQAYSAGTIIALACREIVLQENAHFGDAAPIAALPIFGLQQLSPTERAKLESPLLDEVVDSARRNHYDENLVQSFVSVGVELWLIENIQTGDKVFVDREEYRVVFGEEPPAELTSITPTGGERAVPWTGGRPREDGDAAELEPVQPTRPRLTAADRGNYAPVRQVISADRLLTLRPADAMYYGLAVQIIRNDEELRAYFGAQAVVRYDQSWSEGLARFLMSFPVRAVLVVVFLVALFIELAAPGVGVFGVTAIVALVLLLGAPALVGMAQWWGILLVLVGLVLIGAELFIFPGVGVAGVAGLIALLVGLVGAFITGDLGTHEGKAELWSAVATTLLSVFAAGIIIWLISRQLHSIRIINRLILKTEIGHSGGSHATAGVAAGGMFGAMAPYEAPRPAEGDIGVAHTDLRPAGRGNFDGHVIDVQSPGGYIEKGRPIRIVSVGRYVIDVEEVE